MFFAERSLIELGKKYLKSLFFRVLLLYIYRKLVISINQPNYPIIPNKCYAAI